MRENTKIDEVKNMFVLCCTWN